MKFHLGIAAAVLTGAFAVMPTASAAAPPTTPGFTAIEGSMGPSADRVTGTYTARRMPVEVSLAPRDPAGLDRELTALYTPGSGQYRRFLARGQFAARYAPAAATTAAVRAYLRGRGLTVTGARSPFLIDAVGSSAQVGAAFRTTVRTYAGVRGRRYFANATPVYVPASLRSVIIGVVGLTDTVRARPLTVSPAGRPPGRPGARAGRSCEAAYPARNQLLAQPAKGTGVPVGYGGGPKCSGLTPSQTNAIYGAPRATARTTGTGVTAALFELSGYTRSDPLTWARYFYGKSYRPSLSYTEVDGGPPDASGDGEAVSDIEQEMAVAPHAHLDVYDAPDTSQGMLDEYTLIAKQDTARTVSTSWGLCESDTGEAYARSENTIFEQMAAQGQSVFAAAGDSGALDCVTSDGSSSAAADDPGAQPWVTSVGGTSFGTFNPGTRARPAYPAAGTESVWNVDDLCSQQGQQADNGNLGGPYWCGAGAWKTGSGGGGSSRFWGAPSWQAGPGVGSRYTRHGPSSCALASSASTPCRQVPDVSADADEYTPYAMYCTAGPGTVQSECPTLAAGSGWTPIGGTSLAAPLWAALFTDRDSYRASRAGDVGPLVYGWLRTRPRLYFHDIARPRNPGRLGVFPGTTNGIFPITPAYDEATGIGTPIFAKIITG